MVIQDDNGRERERHKVPYGATLMVADGPEGWREPSWLWDPHPSDHYRIRGRVKFGNIEEGVTVAKQVDDVTGLSTLVVIDRNVAPAPPQGLRPQVKLLDEWAWTVKAGSAASVNITILRSAPLSR